MGKVRFDDFLEDKSFAYGQGLNDSYGSIWVVGLPVTILYVFGLKSLNESTLSAL